MGMNGGEGWVGGWGSDVWNDSSDLGSVCLRYAWLVDKNQSALVSPFVPGPGRACPKSSRRAESRAENRERERGTEWGIARLVISWSSPVQCCL